MLNINAGNPRLLLINALNIKRKIHKAVFLQNIFFLHLLNALK